MEPVTYKPIGVRDFMTKYVQDENIFVLLPEFSFIKSVAAKAKTQNCNCGLGDEINRTISTFNDFIENLDPQLIFKVGQIFELDKVCFAIQKQDSFAVRCY